ncbi:MAG TPA: DUF2071 domain-containing protein [Vicinamibacterales bacterium]|nr:DUF2071 domain-containing protein [Vicinamibacterales bacterium]
MQNDFDDGTLERTAHRPWPMPDGPWLMTQTWHDLAFAHWPVDQTALRAALPAGLELDVFEGQAWMGVVPFHMTNVTPRGVPALPFVSAFPELNVRTYVVAGDKPGVYFFSLDAGNPVAVGFARSLLHLPYHSAAMSVEERDGWVHYRSRRLTDGSGGGADFEARYRPTGPVFEPAAGSLEHFLTERYRLYTVDPRHALRHLDIHHGPWPLQEAEIVLDVNTMVEPTGVRLPDMAPLVHFAKRQDMVAWRMK